MFILANVHFKPTSTLRELRVRLRTTYAHWPMYPAGLGVLTGDLNICDPEEGRFCAASQNFSDGDTERTTTFRVARRNHTRRAVSVDGMIRTLSVIDRAFNIPSAEARDFRCRAQPVDDLGNQSLLSDHTAIRFAIQKRAVLGILEVFSGPQGIQSFVRNWATRRLHDARA